MNKDKEWTKYFYRTYFKGESIKKNWFYKTRVYYPYKRDNTSQYDVILSYINASPWEKIKKYLIDMFFWPI